MPDFEVYWKAGIRARLAEPLYRSEDQHYQLKYLPGFAVLAIPQACSPSRSLRRAGSCSLWRSSSRSAR